MNTDEPERQPTRKGWLRSMLELATALSGLAANLARLIGNSRDLL
jgi:hypothetical protein